MLVFQLICIVLFLGTGIFAAAGHVLLSFGLWGVFRKCGMKGYNALIPCYKYYCLGHCADLEADGREVFFVSVVRTVLMMIEYVYTYFDVNGYSFLFLVLFGLVTALIQTIYSIRIYSGVRRLFRLKKRWVYFMIFFPNLVLPLLGWRERYQPQWKITVLQPFNDHYFSSDNVSGEGDGLAVNLEKRDAVELFSRKTLLRDIHMYLRPGRMVLLLGGSGAGKTTLVNAINGFEKADAEILLNGKDLYRNYKNMQYEVGFVPQSDLMRGNDTVEHTLKDASALRLPDFFSMEERWKRVEAVEELFGLTAVRDSMVEKLSGGQRKRLSIAMEFISNPSLFLLDEPDSGLDGVMARRLMEQLRMITEQGKIVIVITHTPDRVIDLFDDVIVLAKDSAGIGRLAFFGPVPEARSFFGKDTMEEIVRSINAPDEGGEGHADELIQKYREVRHA